ncbi:hypothetical protein P7C73_g6324, partial [Tremellales sp. Uapishka_1]
MLTPPFHFTIVSSSAPSTDTLYRGSLPCRRNLTFLRRLRLKTVVCLRKKPLKDEDEFLRWTMKRGIHVRWIKAESMGEENLGMGRTEVGEVLKIILDPSSYPLYIADKDGISHTTLVVACLRKLQGWNTESILNEICRYEPDHDDFPFLSFLTGYLATADSTLALPPPPYPTWLWPTFTTPP